MEIKILSEATITDANNQSFNRATQDGIAIPSRRQNAWSVTYGNTSKIGVVGAGTVS